MVERDVLLSKNGQVAVRVNFKDWLRCFLLCCMELLNLQDMDKRKICV